jgi:sulfate adenylyltransferase
MKSVRITINRRQYMEAEKIALGAFAPLTGFMNRDEFNSVVETMYLPDNQPFPLPVIFDLTQEQAQQAQKADSLTLVYEGIEIGEVHPQDIFTCNKEAVAKKVYGTSDVKHPGVALFYRMGDYFAGGVVDLSERIYLEFSQYELTPVETRVHFQRQGWQAIVGFQTRNIPHKAHEYLLRLALEQADGLFIQPLVGTKKKGDYAPMAILTAYEALIDNFLPSQRILLGVLSTSMRYAGPREAIFHAIIRRNYGCTHFIVGRDHAGVDNYYKKYEAHELTKKFDGQLGIQILRFFGPFFCKICGGIVTERTCPHIEKNPEAIMEVNGTDFRKRLSGGAPCPSELIRPEIIKSISGMPIFIEENAE